MGHVISTLASKEKTYKKNIFSINTATTTTTSDLHSGKDLFKSLEAKKVEPMTTITDTSATTTWLSWSAL